MCCDNPRRWLRSWRDEQGIRLGKDVLISGHEVYPRTQVLHRLWEIREPSLSLIVNTAVLD